MDYSILVAYYIIPFTMIILGIVLKIKPPKKINGFYGYRTTRSMLSQKAWDYAQVTCARLWVVLGIILFIVTIIWNFIVPIREEYSFVIIMPVGILVLLIPIPIVEKKLKSFENNKGVK
ncbi:SdpI family protein [Clostridium sp.]|uniref:SdpI family protein n=1 Tax=Clostridium sp. TaxID=1506 RepID=UPI002FC96199